MSDPAPGPRDWWRGYCDAYRIDFARPDDREAEDLRRYLRPARYVKLPYKPSKLRT